MRLDSVSNFLRKLWFHEILISTLFLGNVIPHMLNKKDLKDGENIEQE